jgi:hypothetical protein
MSHADYAEYFELHPRYSESTRSPKREGQRRGGVAPLPLFAEHEVHACRIPEVGLAPKPKVSFLTPLGTGDPSGTAPALNFFSQRLIAKSVWGGKEGDPGLFTLA